MRRTKEIIANCILAVEDEGELVAITFGMNRAKGRRGAQEVATVMVTPGAYKDLRERTILGADRVFAS